MKKYKNDILILFILIIVVIFITIITNICKTEGKYVKVSIDDEIYDVYDLQEDTKVSLPTGNTLVIKDGVAYVSESNCPDKICVNHGSISSEGETIICLPNKLVIEICKENADE